MTLHANYNAPKSRASLLPSAMAAAAANRANASHDATIQTVLGSYKIDLAIAQKIVNREEVTIKGKTPAIIQEIRKALIKAGLTENAPAAMKAFSAVASADGGFTPATIIYPPAKTGGFADYVRFDEQMRSTLE